MGTRRNPIDENDDPEDFQDEEDQEQWRQTLIFIGGALSIFLKISTFSQIIGGAKSILIL